MTISMKEDAKQRIEKVVTEYREAQGRYNYLWEVQARYVIDENVLLTFIVASIGAYTIIEKDLAGPLKYPLWLGIALTAMMVAFQIVCRFSKKFKEKVWKRDFISDSDILYLCENRELKENIREDVAALGRVTYSFVLKKMPVYLSDIEYRQKKASNAALLKKIDDN